MSRGVSREEERLIRAAIARMRAGVMAVVFAMVGGMGLALATAWLLVRGGENVGQNLGLLRHYLPGYSVTWPGTLLGLAYGAVLGAIAGWCLARVYNWIASRRHPRVSE